MLEGSEYQSSFCVYGVIGGSPDWGGRHCIRPRAAAVEDAPDRVRQGGGSCRHRWPGEFAVAAPSLMAAGAGQGPEERNFAPHCFRQGGMVLAILQAGLRAPEKGL
jgi:hypothetical protein